MKPECKLCEENIESMSSLFGRDVTEQILYGLFNPKGFSSQDHEIDINELVKSHIDRIRDEDASGLEGYSGWMRRYLKWYEKLKTARKMAWEELLDKIKKGQMQPDSLSVRQMMRHFSDILAEELQKEGFLEQVSEKYVYQNSYVFYSLTARSEKIIAKKVLEEAFLKLKRYGVGLHEIRESGWGVYPSHILREYDEYGHTYDMLDIQETLLSTASRDPREMKMERHDFKARIPLHKAKSSNIILIDKSGSMNGNKIRGAIMAALALRQLMETEFKDDILQVIAYDQTPYLLNPGDIIKLRANGWTDIGKALDLSRELLTREDENRNIFLITDSEPTVSCYPDQTPEASALRASYMLSLEDISINIIMLDRRPELRALCEEMAILNRNATAVYVDDPLNLSEFVIKSYIDMKLSSGN
jgi:uncharacterized protein with von Willebrand factor type A (vWA) domain